MDKERRIFLVIFLCSFSSLAYEIALTRIFSISLWYHFAFMIVSIAMLGIGASGTLLSLYSELRYLHNIGIYTFMLGIAISLSYILSNLIPFDPVRLSWSKTQLIYISFYYVILCMPFFFAGLIIAVSLSCISEKSAMIYGADLLGAGAGSIVVLYLLTLTGTDNAPFILSSIAFITSLITGKKILKAISLILILLNLSILFFQPPFTKLRMSPYKGLQSALRYPGAEHLKTYFSPFSRIDTFKSPAVRFAPGLSLKYLGELPEQIGFSIDGTEVNAITSTRGGNRFSCTDPLRFLRYLPSALPYEIRKTTNTRHHTFSKEYVRKLDDVLVLDPKGGLQVLIAKYYGSKNLCKVESNPLIIKVIKDEFRDFSGSIYDSTTWSGLGRSWLRSNNKIFDVIDISLMGSSPSGSFGISEDYRYTVEAFREYLGHLKPDGVLSINLFILPPPRIELRLINTVTKAMEELGINDIEKNIIAIRSWGSICILIKRSPFTLEEISAVKEFSKDRRFDLVHYPGIKEEETNIYIKMPSNEYFTAFKSLLDPEKRANFINYYIFDIRPVRDENPFFHYYLKLKNIKEIYKIMGEKWQYFIEEGYILPVVFIQVMILSMILIILPILSRRNQNNLYTDHSIKGKLRVFLKERTGKRLLPYFAFIGIGFMLVEISLIQKIILSLENPSYAVATVLTSLLISSGIGAMLSHRISLLRSPLISALISIFIIIYSILLPAISDKISPYLIPLKIILMFFILMPLGLVMGIPFPAGLKILGEINKLLIPWAWAINGCFSVLSPVLTIMLAMAIGFKKVLCFGALMYAMAFVTLRSFLRLSDHRHK